MNNNNLSAPARALGWGFLGVLCFSLTFPATRLAVTHGLDSAFVGLARGAAGGCLAGLALLLRRAPFPPVGTLPRLALVSICVVVGFPFFSSVALAHVPSAHGSVLTGLLPASTAIAGVLRNGERPSGAFWFAAGAGVIAVIIFAISQGAGRPVLADLWILIAVALAGVGYAEGGALARQMDGWQVISWALVISLPVLLPTAAVMLITGSGPAGADCFAWAAFAYLSVISMFAGFVAWYRGLALGGIAKIGQLQLAQPVLTLIWSALLLHEQISAGTVLAASAVLCSVALVQRTRVNSASAP